MTTTPKTPEAMLQTLTWAPCASCGGTSREAISWEKDTGKVVASCPCPSCQDSGVATGLMFPGLTEECPGTMGWIGPQLKHKEWAVCPNCPIHNGRIPRRSDVLEAVLDCLRRMGLLHIQLQSPVGILKKFHAFIPVEDYSGHRGYGNSDTEAAIECLYLAAVAKGLVKD